MQKCTSRSRYNCTLTLKYIFALTSRADCRCHTYDRWNISVLRRDLKVVRDGDVRVPRDMLFKADVAEAANAQLPTVAWLTRGMARSAVDDDRSRFVDWLVRLEIAQKQGKQVRSREGNGKRVLPTGKLSTWAPIKDSSSIGSSSSSI